LRFSVDYYHLDINNAITTTNASTMLSECEKSNGTALVCNLIIRPGPFSDASPANTLTKILVGPVNIAHLSTSGLDIDASYRAELGSGRLNVRLIGNLVFSRKQQTAASLPVVEYAGFTEDPSVPKVRGNLQIDYRVNNFEIFAQERMIGGLKHGPVQVWAEPNVPAVFYTDLTLTAFLGRQSRQQIFFTVNNLFNKTAPIVPIFTGNSNQTLATILPLYDTAGRMFTAGVRLRF
jgi:iron complex outermembrane receptor protein